MEILIDNFDFWDMSPQRYYSFTSSFKGDKKAKAKELVMSSLYIGSRKMDGVWSMIIRDMEGNFHMRSRTESVNGGYQDKAEWVPHICENLWLIPNGTAIIGEIYFPNNEGSRKVTSVLNCLKDKCLERQKKNGYLHFYIFDIVAWDGKSLIDKPIVERIKYFNSNALYKASTNGEASYVELANYVRGKELWNLYGEIIEAGGEGIVITREDCKYLCGKRTSWVTLKLKRDLADTIDAFLDGDYKPATRLYGGKEIENWCFWHNPKTNEKFNTCKFDEYATGTSSVEPITKAYYYGWASAVSFSVMKDGKPEHIAWISGITDELKDGIVNNPEKWKGKVAELQAMMIEHIDGKYSLRHGKIEKWREDKNPEDCDFSQIAK